LADDVIMTSYLSV